MKKDWWCLAKKRPEVALLHLAGLRHLGEVLKHLGGDDHPAGWQACRKMWQYLKESLPDSFFPVMKELCRTHPPSEEDVKRCSIEHVRRALERRRLRSGEGLPPRHSGTIEQLPVLLLGPDAKALERSLPGRGLEAIADALLQLARAELARHATPPSAKAAGV